MISQRNLSKIFKTIMALVFLVAIGIGCFVITDNLSKQHTVYAAVDNTVDAEKSDLSRMAKCTAAYFGFACEPEYDGTMPEEIVPDDMYTVAGLFGFQSRSEDGDFCFYLATHESENKVSYNVTNSRLSSASQYAEYGYKLQQLGFDDVDHQNGSTTIRKIAGNAMVLVYSLSSALTAFGKYTIEFLKGANPFNLFIGSFTGGYSTTSMGLNLISSIIGNYYYILRSMSLFVILPLILVFALTRWLLRDKGRNFGANLKNWFIRFLFVAIGVPMLFSLYDTVLDTVGDSIDNGDGTTIVLSTFCDFEGWVNKNNLDDAGLTLGSLVSSSNGTRTIDTNGFVHVRSNCAKINGLSGLSTGSGAGGAASEEFNLIMSSYSGSATTTDVISLLQRYADGDTVSSAKYAASVSSRITDRSLIDESNHWQDFDPLKVEEAAGMDTTGRAYYHGMDNAAIISTMENHARNRFVSQWGTGVSPWYRSGSGFSPMGMYNYLCSDFTNYNSFDVYASDAGTSSSKPLHYSVNIVGTPVTRFVYYMDALILIGASALLGYLFCIGLIVSNLKAMFHLVPAVMSAFLGSMKGIASTIIITGAMIITLIFTFMLYGFIGQIMRVIYYLIERPVADLIDSFGSGFPQQILYIVMVILSMIFVVFGTKKLLTWRKAIIQAATESFATFINKLLGTNAGAPNLQMDGGALKTAAAAAAGIGIAAANGTFDDTAERLGLSDEYDEAKESLSNTMNSEGADKNPFNVTEDANADTDKLTSSEEDSSLKNKDGDSFKDAEGNDLKVDEDGNLTDSEGNQLLDEEGNPISADSVMEGEDGSLIDKETGEPITAYDAEGNEVGEFSASDTLGESQGEGNGIYDSEGNELTDQYGGSYSYDENGYLVDSKGGHVRDGKGGWAKKGENGKLVDQQGNAIKTADGKIVNSNGDALHNTDGSDISADKTVQNDGTGNAVTSDGQAITGANGEALQIDPETGELIGSDGNPVSDGKGGSYHIDPSTGKLVDSEGVAAKVDSAGNLVSGDGTSISDTKGSIKASGRKASNVLSNGINEKAASNVRADSRGKAVTGSGEAIKDANGQQLSFNENGELVNAQGEVVTDASGNAYSLDGDGNLTDSSGNVVTATDDGRLQDSSGNIVSDNGRAISADVADDTNTDYLVADTNGNISTSNDESISSSNGTSMYVDSNTGELKDSSGNVMKDNFGGTYHKDPATGHIVDSNGNALKVHSDGTISSSGSSAIMGTASSNGSKAAFKANVNRERSGNTIDKAQTYVAGNAAVTKFNHSGTGGKGTYVPSSSDNTGFSPAAKGIVQNSDGTYSLPDGSKVNAVELDQPATSGIITDDGQFMTMADATQQGVDGTECVMLSDGSVVMGHMTGDNSVVLGMETADGGFKSGVISNGQFVSGAVVNGQFVRGRTTANGSVESGYYAADGFHKGSWDKNNNFISSTNASGGAVDYNDVPPALGTAPAAGSVTSNSSGTITMSDGAGGSIPVYADASGNTAIASANGLLYTQSNEQGTFIKTGNNGAAQYHTMNGNAYIGSVKATTVTGADGSKSIAFMDSKGNAVPVISHNGGMAVSDNGDGAIIVNSLDNGQLSLNAGDGTQIAIDNKNGIASLKTNTGSDIKLAAGTNGGWAVVDSSGNAHNIVLDNGHMAIKDGSGGYVRLTADNNGNVMIGEKGQGTYLAGTRNGSIGVNADTTYVVSSSGGAIDIAGQGSSSVAPVVFDSNGQMGIRSGSSVVSVGEASGNAIGYFDNASNIQAVNSIPGSGSSSGTNVSVVSGDSGARGFRAATVNAPANISYSEGASGATNINYSDVSSVGALGYDSVQNGGNNNVVLNRGGHTVVSDVVIGSMLFGRVMDSSNNGQSVAPAFNSSSSVTTHNVVTTVGSHNNMHGGGQTFVPTGSNASANSTSTWSSNVQVNNGPAGNSQGGYVVNRQDGGTVQTNIYRNGSGQNVSVPNEYAVPPSGGQAPYVQQTTTYIDQNNVSGNAPTGPAPSGYQGSSGSYVNRNTVIRGSGGSVAPSGSYGTQSYGSGGSIQSVVITREYEYGDLTGCAPVYNQGDNHPTEAWFRDNPQYQIDYSNKSGYSLKPGTQTVSQVQKSVPAHVLKGAPPVYDCGSSIPTQAWLIANNATASYAAAEGYVLNDQPDFSMGSQSPSSFAAHQINVMGAGITTTPSGGVDQRESTKSGYADQKPKRRWNSRGDKNK